MKYRSEKSYSVNEAMKSDVKSYLKSALTNQIV
jgi:hypothetical protein